MRTKSRHGEPLWNPMAKTAGTMRRPSLCKPLSVQCLLDYRNEYGRKKRFTVGRYGILAPEQARKKAHNLFATISNGADPNADRRRKRDVQTVSELAETYIERHAKQTKRTWAEDQRRLTKYILPALGSRPLASVNRADISHLHDKIGRKAKVEANRVVALVSVMFSKAEEWGSLPDGHPNPAKRVKPFTEHSHDRWVTHEEMPQLWAAIQSEPNIYIRSFFMLSLLLGTRRSELLHAKWENIDLARREIRLPHTKAGNTHILPLSPPAVEILSGLPTMLRNPHVFPSSVEPGKPMQGVKRSWKRIREDTQIGLWKAANPGRATALHAQAEKTGSENVEQRYKTLVLAEIQKSGAHSFDVRFHDLRRTVGSWLATSSSSLPLIGKVLNHADASTTQIYARLTEDAARNALDVHAARIFSIGSAKG